MAALAAGAELRIVHTADLNPEELARARALADLAFEDLSDHDWEHALGGLHVLVHQQAELVGHAAVVQRRLLYCGQALRVGYVEAVAVRADRRRCGYGTAMMQVIDRIIRAAYQLGALGATDEALSFYTSLGWEQWRGPTSALTPTGIVRTPAEDGSVCVLRDALALDLELELTCDWREGDGW